MHKSLLKSVRELSLYKRINEYKREVLWSSGGLTQVQVNCSE